MSTYLDGKCRWYLGLEKLNPWQLKWGKNLSLHWSTIEAIEMPGHKQDVFM